MRMEAVSGPADHAEKCPSCGGAVHRRPFGEMYGGSFISDGRRVEIRGTPPAGFANPIILDPIAQYWDGGLYRTWPSSPYFTRGGKHLHLRVWREVYGSIPKDCHIHHKNDNKMDNCIENLECMPSGEHRALTIARRRARGYKSKFNQLARDKAAAWHGSEAGRLWHSRHAKRSKGWEKWRREDRACAHCGKIFSCLIRKNGRPQKFCTHVCGIQSHLARKKAERDGGRVVSDG